MASYQPSAYGQTGGGSLPGAMDSASGRGIGRRPGSPQGSLLEREDLADSVQQQFE